MKEQLIAKATELADKIDAAFKKADDEKRALTADERQQIQAWETESDSVGTELKNIEEDDKARRRQADRRQSLKGLSVPSRGGRKSDPDDGGTITSQHENQADDPKKGFKSHREFLQSVYDAEMRLCNGYSVEHIDPRLKTLRIVGPSPSAGQGPGRWQAAGSDEARGNSDPAGGFLVPLGFSPELLRVEPEADPVGYLTRKIPMDLPTIKIPARTDKDHSKSVSGGVTVTRRPETVAATASQTTFEQVVLVAHNLMGLSYVTEELMTDSPLAFIAILDMGFRDQFTYALTKERLFGTGVGEFLGMGNAANPSLIAVAKETGQSATTFTYGNALQMRSQCWGYQRAVWVANHDTLPQIMQMSQAVGTGGIPVFQPGTRLGLVDNDVAGILLGRPLVFSEYCQPLGSQGDVLLVNPTEYLEGTYQAMQSAESIHVRFVNNERVFKFWIRNAGQPWWKSDLTPAYSTKHLSPFVVCAAR